MGGARAWMPLTVEIQEHGARRRWPCEEGRKERGLRREHHNFPEVNKKRKRSIICLWRPVRE